MSYQKDRDVILVGDLVVGYRHLAGPIRALLYGRYTSFDRSISLSANGWLLDGHDGPSNLNL